MNRRLPLAAALVAVLALSGCSSVSDTDTAATVDDNTLTLDELDDMLTFAGGASDSGDDVRSFVATWITYVAAHDALVRDGKGPDDAARTEARTQLEARDGFGDISASAQDELVMIIMTDTQLNALGAAGTDVVPLVTEALRAADVDIAPRIGAMNLTDDFDASTLVVPLGR